MNNQQTPARRAIRLAMPQLLSLCLAACTAIPGIRLHGPRSTWFPPAPDEQSFTDPEVVPITPQLIGQLESARAAPKLSVPASTEKDGAYRVGPGDALSIVVFNHPELSNPLGITTGAEQSARVIREDGTLFFPFVGVMQVNGMTTEQIRKILAAELAAYIFAPEVDVQVVSYRSRKVYVTGEVNTPAIMPITDRPLTLLDAIETAGGFTDNADKTTVVLTRGGEQQTIDLAALYRRGEGNLILRHGDVVHVPDIKSKKVFVMGEVREQTAVPIEAGRLSLADALAAAGGLALNTADTGEVYVVRAVLGRDEKGNQTLTVPRVYQLDTRSVPALLLAERFELEPRDVVFVAAPGLVHWNRALAQIFPTVATLFAGERVFNN